MTLATYEHLTAAAAHHEENGRHEQADELQHLANLSKPANYEEDEAGGSLSLFAQPGQLFADMEETEIGWLWYPWISLGRVTIFVGPSQGGKSTVAGDLIARVTNGWPMPDGSPGYPGGCVVISLEEEASSEVLPRLKRLGADTTKVRDLSTVPVTSDGINSPVNSPFQLPRDIGILEATIKAVHAALVIVDPLMSVTQVSMNRNQSVRQFVGELQDLARRLDVAVLIINHYTKAKSGTPIERMYGSGAIGHFPRSVFALTEDRTDPRKKTLSLEKHSNTPGVKPLVLRMTENGRIEYIQGLTPSQQMIQGANTESKNRHSIIETLKAEPAKEFTPTYLCQVLDIPGPTCRVTLKRLAEEGKIEKTFRGLYRFPQPVQDVTNVSNDTSKIPTETTQVLPNGSTDIHNVQTQVMRASVVK